MEMTTRPKVMEGEPPSRHELKTQFVELRAMSHKDPETNRAYHREYMRRRRGAVKPDDAPVLTPAIDEPQFTRRRQMSRVLDQTRPYTVESRYPWPAYLIQDDLWFDPNSGELVGKVR
jgi:hypothetical protein